MNAFFGFVQFNASKNYTKHTAYIKEVCTAFPSRFINKKPITKTALTIVGNVEVFDEAEGAKENTALLFIGEIYNKQALEYELNIPSSKNNAALLYALIIKKGLKAIKTVNGQFLIIYIDEQHKIHFINDQMGIKQLYYYQNNDILLFGSEIKFLLPHPDCPKTIDWENALRRPIPSTVLSCFKSYTTWFKDINLLPEASIIEIDPKKNKIDIQPYWNYTEQLHYDYSNDNRTAEIVMEEYIHLLDDAIKIRTNDNNNYALLSGGLDSSAIAALCAKHGPFQTFSIITQITYLESTTDICKNLSSDLNIGNAQFLIPMHKITFNADLWKQWIWRIESPDNHTDSLTKTLLHYAIRKNYPNVQSVLTGTGSDQFNGGLVRWIVNDGGTVEENWENFNRAIQDVENQQLITRSDATLWNYRHLINRDYLASITDQTVEQNTWLFYVKAALHSEIFSLLWDEVRASNYHGHETRFPFLDFRFVDFIAKIPPKLHKDLFFDKTILRKPLKNILPDYVRDKRKAPAYIPAYDHRFKLFNFLTQDMSLVEEALGNINQLHPVINKPAFIKKIKLLQEKPDIFEWNNVMQIFNLCLLERMVDKTEKDMNIESLIEEPIEINFTDGAKTKILLETKLSIQKKEIDIQKPISFCENCALLFNKLNNKYFLAKKNELVFEIEDEYIDWKLFLENIDNQKSTEQILNILSIPYTTIESFLKIAVEEQILSVA